MHGSNFKAEDELDGDELYFKEFHCGAWAISHDTAPHSIDCIITNSLLAREHNV